MGSHSLLQGIFPTRGSNLGLPNSRQILYLLSQQGILIQFKGNTQLVQEILHCPEILRPGASRERGGKDRSPGIWNLASCPGSPCPPSGRTILENSAFHSLCLLIPENSASFRRSAHFTVTSWESLLSLGIWHFAVSNFQCQGTLSTCCVNNLLVTPVLALKN